LVGLDGYGAGAKILTIFLEDELVKFNTEDLNPLGRQIIDMFFNKANVNDYMDLIPMRY
jgi:hypothetical protein